MKKLLLLICALLGLGASGAWATDGSVTITSNSTLWSANGTFTNISSPNAGSWRSTNGIISVLCLNGEAAILDYETKSRLTNGKSFLIVANGDYHITGFSIKFKTYNEDGTNRNGYITFHDDVRVNSNSSAEVTKSFSGLNAQVIKFTTGNDWVDIIDFSVSYADGSDNTLCSTTPINTYNSEAFAGWLKVQTPSDYIFYTMSSLRMNLRTSNYNYDVYLVVSDHQVGSGTTSGLSESDFTAISSNSSGTSSTDVTFNFTNPVTLRGGSIYYLYFATKSNNTYTLSQRGIKVQTGSNSLGVGANVNDTGIYSGSEQWSIPFTATLTPVTSNLKCRLKAKWPNTSTSGEHFTNYVFAKTDNLNKLYKNNKTELTAADMINAKMVWNVTYSGSGLKLQNVGTERYISKFSSDKSNGDAINLLTADNSTNAETLKIQEYNTQGQGYIALVSGNQLSVNNRISFLESFSSTNDYVGCHNNYDAGDAFIFERVKTVTFVDGEGEAFNVAVNGGDAVSAIYVACDGSSASTLSLPSDNLYSLDSGETWLSNTDAAEIISAVGTSNISVIVAPAVSVTYNLIWDSTPIKTKASVNAPQGFSPSVTVPWTAPDYCNFTYDVATIAAETTEVNVTLNWTGPFEFSTDYANAKWYYMKVGGEYAVADGTTNCPTNAEKQFDESALWAFIGNPYDGFTIANYSTGSSNLLSLGSPVQMNSDQWFKLCFAEKTDNKLYIYNDPNDPYYLILSGHVLGAGNRNNTYSAITIEPYIVTYNLKFGGSTIATKTMDKVTGDSKDLFPSEWARDFCTYSYEPAEIGNSTTSVDVTMTWSGPFDISADYATAKWYYLAVNGKWGKNSSSGYLNAPDIFSDIADVREADDGQWAFFGNPYDGFLLSLKEKYMSTIQMYLSSQLTAPAFGNATGSTEKWTVKRLSDTTFTLNCGDKYIEDNSTTMGFKTTALEGSEGTFSVRSYYCQQALDDLADYAETNAVGQYFGVKQIDVDNLETFILGYPKMTYSEYTSTFPALFSDRITTYYPPTGYYRLRNYKGDHDYYLNASSESLNGITDNTTASTIVRLINVDNKNSTFKIQMQGKFAQTPADQTINTLNTSEIEFTPTIALKNGESWVSLKASDLENAEAKTNLNLNGSNNIVGWTAKGIDTNPASYWKIEGATSFSGAITNAKDNTDTERSFATLCVPFAISELTGADAYMPTVSGDYVELGDAATVSDGTLIPAGTPVILVGAKDAGTYTATIKSGTAPATSPAETNVLTGTFTGASINCASGSNNYVLGFDSENDKRIGFYHVSGGSSYALKANRAYLDTSAGVKGFAISFGETDGIKAMGNTAITHDGPIFNLAGQRISKLQRGVNIVKGKKVIVK